MVGRQREYQWQRSIGASMAGQKECIVAGAEGAKVGGGSERQGQQDRAGASKP